MLFRFRSACKMYFCNYGCPTHVLLHVRICLVLLVYLYMYMYSTCTVSYNVQYMYKGA